jgi:hypothetical protein
MIPSFEKVRPVIDRKLQCLVDNHIISSHRLQNARTYTITEFALRFGRYIHSGIPTEDESLKLKSLFGEPFPSQFVCPRSQHLATIIGQQIDILQREYPSFQGFIFFGSRANLHSTPRNITKNPSDIDLLSVWDNDTGDVVPRCIIQALEKDLALLLIDSSSVFNRVPVSIAGHERASSVMYILENPHKLSKTPFWTHDPDGAIFIGSSLELSRRQCHTSVEFNRLLHQSLSCPDFDVVRKREIATNYHQLTVN